MFQSNTDLIYSPNINNSQYNFLYVSDEFLETLEENGEIVVQNNPNQDIRFYGRSQSFHLANIKYLNTLLVDQNGTILRENNNYLKVETRVPNTNFIFEKLAEKQLHYKEVVGTGIQQLVEMKGLTLGFICDKFKISPQEFIKFAEKASYIQYQNPISGERSFIIVSMKSYCEIFLTTYTYLISNSLPLENIDIESFYAYVYPKNQIDFNVYKKACQYFMTYSPESMKYSVLQGSIVKYILTEMGESRNEYLKQEFDQVFAQMIDLYMPVNIKKSQSYPQISDYFLYVKQNNQMNYYKKLLLPLTIKELIVYLSKTKKKYSFNEIKGLMGHLFQDKRLQQAINKHFRKFGEQYELKAVVLA